MSNQPSLPPLPARSVRYTTAANQVDQAAVEGMLSNPVYVGVPPFPRLVSDEEWVQAAVQLIEKKGAAQFLVDMLYMLRISMVDTVPDEAIPGNYDGPWPYEEEEEEAELDAETALPSPWHYPMEGYIFCSHDNMPMILVEDNFVCTAEYLLSHINYAPVTDLITEPLLTLVFQNGHTLPLHCPGCGKSLHIQDHSELLDTINGLTIVGLEWDEEVEELVVDFGHPGRDEEAEPEVIESLSLHLDSVRGLTCPYQKAWHDEEE